MATFRDYLLFIGTHIQRTKRALTSLLTPRQIGGVNSHYPPQQTLSVGWPVMTWYSYCTPSEVTPVAKLGLL